MSTEELTQLYRSIRIEDATVQRVLDSLPQHEIADSTRRRHRLPSGRLAISVAALAVLIAAAVYVSVHTGRVHPGPVVDRPSPSAPPSPTLLLPAERPDTLSGAVARHGRPVAGAHVSVALQPISAIVTHLKAGQTVPVEELPAARTDAHGRFVITISRRDLQNRRFRDHDVINFEIDVTTADHGTLWNATFTVDRNETRPMRMVFDFGSRTIRVNGHRSALPIQ